VGKSRSKRDNAGFRNQSGAVRRSGFEASGPRLGVMSAAATIFEASSRSMRGRFVPERTGQSFGSSWRISVIIPTVPFCGGSVNRSRAWWSEPPHAGKSPRPLLCAASFAGDAINAAKVMIIRGKIDIDEAAVVGFDPNSKDRSVGAEETKPYGRSVSSSVLPSFASVLPRYSAPCDRLDATRSCRRFVPLRAVCPVPRLTRWSCEVVSLSLSLCSPGQDQVELPTTLTDSLARTFMIPTCRPADSRKPSSRGIERHCVSRSSGQPGLPGRREVREESVEAGNVSPMVSQLEVS